MTKPCTMLATHSAMSTTVATVLRVRVLSASPTVAKDVQPITR